MGDFYLIDGLQSNLGDRRWFEEWKSAGLTAVNLTVSIWEDTAETLAEISRWERIIEENSDCLLKVDTVDDIREAKETGRTGIIFGFQNTAALADRRDNVGMFARLGVRVMMPTYNVQNSVGCGCWEKDDTGISEFVGRSLLEEMNRHGVLIDVSHCGEQTCLTAAEISDAPIAITHGNPLSFVGDKVELNRRNRSDRVINTITERGGLIGLSVYPRIAPNGDDCTREDFVEMTKHTVEMVGVDHVGLGTDFCLGFPRERFEWFRTGFWGDAPAVPVTKDVSFPRWVATPAQLSELPLALLEGGFTREEVEKIAGLNFLQLFETVWARSEASVPA